MISITFLVFVSHYVWDTEDREREMSQSHFKMIDQTIGVMIVGIATALFAVPFALVLSSAFIVGM